MNNGFDVKGFGHREKNKSRASLSLYVGVGGARLAFLVQAIFSLIEPKPSRLLQW